MLDLTAIIATVFHPATLEPLVQQLRDEGAHVVVVEGRKTNAAWNLGVASAQTRYAAILNDDIVLSNGAAKGFLRHHDVGFSLVTACMWRRVFPEDTPDSIIGEPWDKGHAFSMDLSLGVPPIPNDLEIYFGDDWFYFHHRQRGRCCIAKDVSVKTGWDIGHSDISGFSCHHAQVESFLGEPILSVARRDHAAARKYFFFRREFRRPEEKPFPEACPCVAGVID